nr:glycosyltransferase family 4 protein [Devosia faecipullorum]
MPKDVRALARGYDTDRFSFAWATLRAARSADTLLLGHINLLPLGWLAKAFKPRLRLILFVHGIEVWDDPAYRRRRWYEPALLRAVACVASVSQETARIMAERLNVPASRFAILPNAIDGPVRVKPTSPQQPVFLCVTRMEAHDHGKNIDKLLQAFALMPRESGAVLEIIGDGALRPRLQALSETLEGSERVRFLGRVSDDERDAAYRRASAFVLPSTKEGFGIVYLEAWKHGLPVICGHVGGARDIVTDGEDGFVVDPENIVDLASSMRRLATNPSRAAVMGRKGAQKLTASYLDDSFRKNLSLLLTEAL